MAKRNFCHLNQTINENKNKNKQTNQMTKISFCHTNLNI
jgi:hypothetical protein